MTDQVTVRRWQDYWNDYICEGKKKGLKNEEIRRNLIEAFRKEIFGLVMFRAKVDDLDDLQHTKNNDVLVNNVFRNELNKWKRLVQECGKYLSTALLIKEGDLTLFDSEEKDDEEEDDEDDGYEIGEAEDEEAVELTEQ